jgi:hypothetical protein
MTLIRHAQVMKITFRMYTSMYTSRRRFTGVSLDEMQKLFIEHGIKIDTNEHNRKLTITIELC